MIHVLYVSAILIIVIFNYIERRDLYNRIMSKSYGEYKNEAPHPFISKHKKVIERWKKRGDEE